MPAGRYLLEVSSPGLERRLRYPDHFARYIGEEVTVKTAEPVNDTRRLRGTLTSASEDDITLRVSISPRRDNGNSRALGLRAARQYRFHLGSTSKRGQTEHGRQQIT